MEEKENLLNDINVLSNESTNENIVNNKKNKNRKILKFFGICLILILIILACFIIKMYQDYKLLINNKNLIEEKSVEIMENIEELYKVEGIKFGTSGVTELDYVEKGFTKESIEENLSDLNFYTKYYINSDSTLALKFNTTSQKLDSITVQMNQGTYTDSNIQKLSFQILGTTLMTAQDYADNDGMVEIRSLEPLDNSYLRAFDTAEECLAAFKNNLQYQSEDNSIISETTYNNPDGKFSVYFYLLTSNFTSEACDFDIFFNIQFNEEN